MVGIALLVVGCGRRGPRTPTTVNAREDGRDAVIEVPATSIRLTDADALAIIRHSSAHVMADAVQRLFPGTKVAFGPAVENGFYYDYRRPNGESFSEDDLRRIEETMGEIIKADHPFRREDVSKDDARAELARLDEPFKLEHLERLEGQISLYRHGNWVDRGRQNCPSTERTWC